ncbi:hypothetical protein GGF46_003039 [Coemansia sp. RSA 552]|nr:hypothetical protein GGF46_003039 [Coemansia sp. RSA 552]
MSVLLRLARNVVSKQLAGARRTVAQAAPGGEPGLEAQCAVRAAAQAVVATAWDPQEVEASRAGRLRQRRIIGRRRPNSMRGRVRYGLSREVEERLLEEDAEFEELEMMDYSPRSVLVRELVWTIRQFGGLLGSVTDADERSGARRLAEKAWQQYRRITERSNATELINEIPSVAATMLVCELGYQPRGGLMRLRRVEQIMSDRAAAGCPLRQSVAVVAYVRAMNGLHKHRAAMEALDAFREHSGSEYLPSGLRRQEVLAYFGGCRPDLAAAAFDQMRMEGVASPHAYATYIEGALKAGSESAESLRTLVAELVGLLAEHSILHGNDDQRAVSTGVLNELLTAATTTGNMPFMNHVLERLVAAGVTANTTTLGMLVSRACASESDTDTALRVYTAMIRAAPERLPQGVYGAFINAFIRLDRPDCALDVARRLRKEHQNHYTDYVKPLFVYYAETRRPRDAMALLASIPRPSWDAYILVVRALGRSKGVDAESRSGSSGDLAYRLLAAIANHARRADGNGVLDALADLLPLTVESPRYSILALTTAFVMARRTAVVAISRADQGEGMLGRGLAGDDDLRLFVRKLGPLADHLCGAPLGWNVPQDLYHVGMSLYALVEDTARVQTLYNHMVHTVGMAPSRATADALLRSFTAAHAPDAVASLLHGLRTDSMPISTAAAATALHGLLLDSRPHLAIDLYAHMVGRPTPLLDNLQFTAFFATTPCDEFTYALLVKGLIDAGLVREALVVFEDAFSVLPVVSRQLLSTLLNALIEGGLTDLSRQCSARYHKRVEAMQPPIEENGVEMPDVLPLSYFGYLLEKYPGPDN